MPPFGSGLTFRKKSVSNFSEGRNFQVSVGSTNTEGYVRSQPFRFPGFVVIKGTKAHILSLHSLENFVLILYILAMSNVVCEVDGILARVSGCGEGFGQGCLSFWW